MKTTINSDLSSCTLTDDEQFECVLPNYNPETLRPFVSEDDVLAFVATVDMRYFQPHLTEEEKQEQAAAIRSAEHVARAKQELLDTDWCENASVRNTETTPHLANAAEYDAYRLALRAIVVSKPADVPEWPAKPDSVWST